MRLNLNCSLFGKQAYGEEEDEEKGREEEDDDAEAKKTYSIHVHQFSIMLYILS